MQWPCFLKVPKLFSRQLRWQMIFIHYVYGPLSPNDGPFQLNLQNCFEVIQPQEIKSRECGRCFLILKVSLNQTDFSLTRLGLIKTIL